MNGSDIQDAIDAIANDSLARRELLWLGAMEHDDAAEAQRLEQRQAGLSEHMCQLLAERMGGEPQDAPAAGSASGPPGERPPTTSRSYARLFNERWAYHATRLTGRRWNQTW
ncbi:MAG: hypothetical protein JRI68_02030 [Deltaproteobacteria bacterium]|nr:hypothetical protein [Deltaproteobacteria bacterium]